MENPFADQPKDIIVPDEPIDKRIEAIRKMPYYDAIMRVFPDYLTRYVKKFTFDLHYLYQTNNLGDLRMSVKRRARKNKKYLAIDTSTKASIRRGFYDIIFAEYINEYRELLKRVDELGDARAYGYPVGKDYVRDFALRRLYDEGFDQNLVAQIADGDDTDYETKLSPYGDITFKINSAFDLDDVEADPDKDEPSTQRRIADMLTKRVGPAERYAGYNFSVWETNEDGIYHSLTPRPPLSLAYSPMSVARFIVKLHRSPKYIQQDIRYVQIYPAATGPQKFRLFDPTPAALIPANCLFDAAARQAPQKLKKIREYVAKFPALAETGVDQDAVLAASRAIGLRFVIHSQTGIWFDTYPTIKSKYKQVVIYAHNGHASVYTPIRPAVRVTYIDDVNEMCQLSCEIHQPMKLKYEFGSTETGEPDIKMLGFRTGDAIYKTYKPSAPEDANDPAYFGCFSDGSFAFKKFLRQNNIRPLSEPYYSIFKAADHHLTSQWFDKTAFYELRGKQGSCFEVDMKKAFPSFKQSPYYARYGLIVGYVSLYQNNDLSYLARPGASLVSRIIRRHPAVERTGYIEAGQWYVHHQLQHMIDLGAAEFEISYSVICMPPGGREDLNLPFRPFDSPDLADKRFNNTFIGRFIAGSKQNEIIEYYQATDPAELLQMRYELTSRSDFISAAPCGIMEGVIEAHFTAKAKQQLWNIHSCILAYQQMTMMEELIHLWNLPAGAANIIAINTDGIYMSADPQKSGHRLYPSAEIEARFTTKGGKIRFDTVGDPAMRSNGTIVDVEALNAPPLAIHIGRLGYRTLTNGPPGCGKSYNLIEKYPLVGAAVLAPTNVLKAKMKATGVRADRIDTYHKFFGLNVADEAAREASVATSIAAVANIVIDEITMVPAHIFANIIAICSVERVNLHVIGDIDERGIHQRPPIKKLGEPIKWDTFGQTSVTHWLVVTEISQIRRQTAAADWQFLDSLRGLTQHEQVGRFLARYTAAGKHVYEALTDQGLNTQWRRGVEGPNGYLLTHGIGAVHRRTKELNRIAYDTEFALLTAGLDEEAVHRFEREWVRARGRYIGKTTKGGVTTEAKIKGTIDYVPKNEVWFGRLTSEDELPKGVFYEAAYFTTVDAIQGHTFEGPLFIDINALFMENYFYTAITRARRLDDIILIK